MTDTLRDQIAAAVSLHEVYAVTEQDEMNAVLPPSRWKCECGDEGPLPPFEKHKAEEAVWQTNAEHIADAILATPGIAVVELPEQMVDREAVPQAIRHMPMWEQRHAWSTIQGDGLIYFENGSGGSGYGTVNAAEARDLAAALLAAADYAERDQ